MDRNERAEHPQAEPSAARHEPAEPNSYSVPQEDPLWTLGQFAIAFLGGLAAGAEHGCDLGPRVSVAPGLGHGIGQLHLAPGNSAYGIADAAQATGIGVGRSNSPWKSSCSTTTASRWRSTPWRSEGVALRRHAPSTAVAGHGCRVDATGRQELDKRRGSITATDDRR